MPKVFEIEGYRGFFFSNEGTPMEPIHIHIKKGEGEAKFWITPTVRLAESWNLKVSELTRAQEIVVEIGYCKPKRPARSPAWDKSSSRSGQESPK